MIHRPTGDGDSYTMLPAHMASGFPRRTHLLAAAFVAIVAAAAVWPTRHGDFLNGDDQRFIIEHGLVNRPSWSHAATLLTVVHQDLYQPIPMLSFMANYAVAAPGTSRREVPGMPAPVETTPGAQFPVSARNFKLTNIALHVINAVLVYWLITLLARFARIACISAALFAIHPYVIEPVGWICGRMILLGTLFALVTLIACLRPAGDVSQRGTIAGAVAWALSLLSKIIPTVPVAGAWLRWRRDGRLARRDWLLCGGLLAMSGAMVAAALFTTDRFGIIELSEKEVSSPPAVRLLLASRYYLENFVWPSRIAAWSPPPENVGLASPAVLIALMEWAAFGVIAWVAARRSPLAFTGLVAFVILMTPFLAATLARRFLTADRYMYLPMIGLHLAIAAAIVQAVDRWRARLGTGVARLCGAAALCGLAIVWLPADFRLAPTWRSTVARDLHMAAVYPDAVDVQAELAKAYLFENRVDEALAVIAKARLRWPDSPRLALQAGIAHRFRQDWAAAERELAQAARQMPDNSRVLYYYGRTLEMVGRDADALETYHAVLRRDPDYVPVLMALGDFHYFKSGDLAAARECLERAVAVSPFQRDAIYQLVMVAVRTGDWPAVEPRCRQILDLNPGDRPALLNLGVAMANLGRPDEALEIYNRLIAIEPAARAPRLNRALLLAARGDAATAEQELRSLLRLDPADRDARIGLHDLLAALAVQTSPPAPERIAQLEALWAGDADAGGGAAVVPGFEREEVDAWRAWVEAIRGDRAACEALRAALPPRSVHRSFADWALAWLVLSTGGDDHLRDLLGPPLRRESISAGQRQYAASVRPRLAGLPEHIANSDSGRYALARWMYFAQTGSVRTAVSQLAKDPGRYANAANELTALLLVQN